MCSPDATSLARLRQATVIYEDGSGPMGPAVTGYSSAKGVGVGAGCSRVCNCVGFFSCGTGACRLSLKGFCQTSQRTKPGRLGPRVAASLSCRSLEAPQAPCLQCRRRRIFLNLNPRGAPSGNLTKAGYRSAESLGTCLTRHNIERNGRHNIQRNGLILTHAAC
jgi:hypothetical protein